MNNEIKEIIRLNCDEEIDVKYFAKDDSLVYTTMDYSQLLDYITNLQIENEDYKSRCEKVNKYIDDWLFEAGGNGACMDYEDIIEIKHILNGGDE